MSRCCGTSTPRANSRRRAQRRAQPRRRFWNKTPAHRSAPKVPAAPRRKRQRRRRAPNDWIRARYFLILLASCSKRRPGRCCLTIALKRWRKRWSLRPHRRRRYAGSFLCVPPTSSTSPFSSARYAFSDQLKCSKYWRSFINSKYFPVAFNFFTWLNWVEISRLVDCYLSQTAVTIIETHFATCMWNLSSESNLNSWYWNREFFKFQWLCLHLKGTMIVLDTKLSSFF